MAKIYISSTFEDLKDFRARAYTQLRKSRHDVLSMEDYNPSGRAPLEKCLEDVRNADIYVGLLGWCYGSLSDEDDSSSLSFTEHEYREALNSGKELIVFLSDPNAPWAPKHMDSHTGAGESGARISALRNSISKAHIRGFFKTPDDLAAGLSPAIEEACQKLTPSSARQLDQIPTLSRDQLELLAARFDAKGAHSLSDAQLRDFLTQKAEEYRDYRNRIEGLDARVAAIGNLKGAARDAAERLDFDEVEELLARVDEVETEIAAETKETRAANALLRGRVQDAYDILSSAADSFGGIDRLEPARRRLTYEDRLYAHGLRYGGAGLTLAADMNRRALDDLSEESTPDLWARAQNNLAIALRNQGSRTGGEQGTALLAGAVSAYRAALRVWTEADHPVQWAMTQNNLGNALMEQGSRTGGEQGAALMAKAVSACRAALRVWTEADHPVDWAMAQNNLGTALQEQGSRTGGAQGATLLAEAVSAYRAALRVWTEADHPVDWAMAQNNLGTALQEQGSRTGGAQGATLLAEAVSACRAALRVWTEADHPVQWAGTQNNLAAALQEQGSRTGGEQGATLLAKAVSACRAALRVRTETDHPVDWAMTHVNMALAELAIADHDGTADPVAHLQAAFDHVEAALTIFDPQHLPYNHAKATRLRDRLRARLGRD